MGFGSDLNTTGSGLGSSLTATGAGAGAGGGGVAALGGGSGGGGGDGGLGGGGAGAEGLPPAAFCRFAILVALPRFRLSIALARCSGVSTRFFLSFLGFSSCLVCTISNI